MGGVQAHVGGPASQASEALGARAYAMGNAVAFAEAPDLHTAAHEAAHVVQQRSGLKLDGDMGSPGDPYEQHADQVADLVVAGRSAQGLLDSVAGGPGSPPRGSGPLQLLEDDDQEKLEEYARGQYDALGVYVPDKEYKAKVALIGNAHNEKRDALAKAKADVDAWLKSKVKPSAPPAQDPPTVPAAAASSHQESETQEKKETAETHEEEATEDASQKPSRRNQKAKKKQTMSLAELHNMPPDSQPAPMNYGAAANGAVNLPTPQVTSQKASKAGPVWSKFKAWKPSQGHGGCKAPDLDAREVQELADQAAAPRPILAGPRWPPPRARRPPRSPPPDGAPAPAPPPRGRQRAAPACVAARRRRAAPPPRPAWWAPGPAGWRSWRLRAPADRGAPVTSSGDPSVHPFAPVVGAVQTCQRDEAYSYTPSPRRDKENRRPRRAGTEPAAEARGESTALEEEAAQVGFTGPQGRRDRNGDGREPGGRLWAGGEVPDFLQIERMAPG